LCFPDSSFANTPPPPTDRIVLTVEVRTYGSGFRDDAWVSQSPNRTSRLCRDIVWPVSIATFVAPPLWCVNRRTKRYPSRHRALLPPGFFSCAAARSAAGRGVLLIGPEDEREALSSSFWRGRTRKTTKPARAPRSGIAAHGWRLRPRDMQRHEAGAWWTNEPRVPCELARPTLASLSSAFITLAVSV